MSLVTESAGYLRRLGSAIQEGWTRFWFAPSDPYPLGVVRIGAGLVGLYLLLIYTFDIARLFAADGLVPAETAKEMFRLEREVRFGTVTSGRSVDLSWVSYLYYFRHPSELYVVHALGGIVLLLFTVGFFTRLTAIGSLIVALAYLHRGWMLAGPVDHLLPIVIFYLCFAPCGAYLSVDRWIARRRKAIPLQRGLAEHEASPSWAATVVSRLLQIHLLLIYAMMALGQVASDAWWDGSAVWWIVARPETRLIDFRWIRFSPHLMHLAAYALVAFEVAFVVLVWNRVLRPLMLALSIVFWVFLGLISAQMPLALLMIAAQFVFWSPRLLREICGKES